MSSSAFLGLDIGTSGVKAILVARDGEVTASTTIPLTLDTPRPGWAEQHPDAWWRATQDAVRQLRDRHPDVHIESVGISGQMHSSVFLDRDGAVVRPALLWCDGRTTAQCREIVQRAGGESQLREWVSNPALEGFTLPKLLWLREQEPEAWSRTSQVMLAKDFIRLRLTGRAATEPSDASGTLMFDPVRGEWQPELLRAMEIDDALLPPIGGSHEVLGHLTAHAAALTGLSEGTPVVGGGADNACGAAGVGCVAPGDAVASWGTSGTVLSPTSAPVVDPALRAHTFAHVAPNTWYVMGVILSAGGAFAWYRDQLARDLLDAADRQLDDEAATVVPGAEGVTFLPYLQGERTPHRDASARGAFLGLSLAHTRAHMTRAVVEGICFAMRDSFSILRELNVAPAQLLLTGGGAKSALLRKLQSEIYGVPVMTVNREEGPAYGAALLAAVGVGAYATLADAAHATLTRTVAAHADASSTARYDHAYARYRAAYAALRPILAMS